MAGAVIENILYFSDRYSNGLYQLNLDNNEYMFIDYFLDEGYGEWLYFQAYVWEKKIYFIPGLAENIACFDTILKEISYIKLPQEGRVIRGVNGLYAEKFCCQKHENVLWMMPVGYNLFLKFDLSNEQLFKIDLPECIKFIEGIFNWRTSFLYRNELIFQPWAGTIQLHYDIITGYFKLEKFKENIRTYRTCLKNEDFEIYVPLEIKNGLLIKNRIDKKKKKILFDRNIIDNSVINYTCDVPILIENRLYIIPQFGKHIIILFLPDFYVEYINLNKEFNKDYLFWRGSSVVEDNYKYYIFSAEIPEILEIDKENGHIGLIKLKQESDGLKDKRIRRCLENLNRKAFQVMQKRILNEGKNELEDLILLAMCYLKYERIEDYYYGKIIYENLKRSLK